MLTSGGARRVNRRNILSKKKNQFSVHLKRFGELKSTTAGLRLFHGSITRLEKKYFLVFIELKGTYNLYGWPRVVLTGLGVKNYSYFKHVIPNTML